MMKKLKRDKRYTIRTIKDSTLSRVFFEDSMIALVMNQDTARQVIYRDILDNGGECKYLHDGDFTNMKGGNK